MLAIFECPQCDCSYYRKPADYVERNGVNHTDYVSHFVINLDKENDLDAEVGMEIEVLEDVKYRDGDGRQIQEATEIFLRRRYMRVLWNCTEWTENRNVSLAFTCVYFRTHDRFTWLVRFRLFLFQSV